MAENKDIYTAYEEFLQGLATQHSTQRFSNGGKDFAPILMSVLYQHTDAIARIYCEGFRPDIIKHPKYWGALIDYLDKNKRIEVLVKTDKYLNQEPLKTLLQYSQNNLNSQISVRRIGELDQERINNRFKGNCNFAIFDTDKYRMEYEPEDFRAFGSFNEPRVCDILISEFDRAFNHAEPLIQSPIYEQ